MRVTSIELAGEPARAAEGGGGAPRAFAKISRRLDGDKIRIELFAPDGETEHWLPAGDTEGERELRWEMAERLQLALDGGAGTSSMVHDYYRELQRFAD